MTIGKVYSPSPTSRLERCKGKTLDESMAYMVKSIGENHSEQDPYHPSPFTACACEYLYRSSYSPAKCAKFETIIVLTAANGNEFLRYRFRPDTHAYPT